MPSPQLKHRFDRSLLLPLSLVLLTGGALAAKAWSQSHYSSDEVFSAIALADLPAFQTASYYPLPNNHVFFNLLNGLFSFATEDLVFSGRLISVFAFMGVLILTFILFVKLNGRRWQSLLFTILVAVQFPIWGWSGQARGYELMLLLAMVSLLAMWRSLDGEGGEASRTFTVAIALGLFTQPAFLFWWAGLFAGGLMIAAGNKAALRHWVFANASAGALALIFYLPLLTFSGAGAITSNPYVQPSADGTLAFLHQLQQQNYLAGLFTEWLPLPWTEWLAPAILPVALVVLFRSGKRQRELALVGTGIFLTTVLMVILMRKAPFYRVFIAHGWLFWVLALAAFAGLLKSKWRLILVPLIIACILYSARFNRRLIPLHLYYYDVNARFEKLKACQLPDLQGKSVVLSDESFNWWPVLDIPVSYGTARINGQDLLIMHRSEHFPPNKWGYSLRKECGEFLIYER